MTDQQPFKWCDKCRRSNTTEHRHDDTKDNDQQQTDDD